MPTEKPILFSGPMVRAILSGQKTVTRRVVKVQPFDLSWSRRDHRFEYVTGRAENGDEVDGFHAYTTRHGGEWSAKCPYGQPGDRLWVREAWARIRVAQAPDQEWVVYREGDNRTDYGGPWKPGIHMFRKDSRLLLEITAVRVERLQDITRSDIRAEGLQCPPELAGDDVSPNYRDWYPAAWKELWNSTGGDWDANPWVWVVEFKLVIP